MKKIAVVGPVYPFRAGIAHCTTRLHQELSTQFDVTLISFKRQYPRFLYPGESDVDPTLRDRTPAEARFLLDILNPLTWIRCGRLLAQSGVETVIFVWWIWLWALPFLVIRRLLPTSTRVILQCHNVEDKEPAWWKSALANLVFRRADISIVHAATDEEELRRRGAKTILRTFLPVHEMGGEAPSREVARRRLGLSHSAVALMFGHVRPFKGLDIALQAWARVRSNALLLVAGEIWWGEAPRYQKMIAQLGLGDRVRFDTRFIPDAEIAGYFAAADVVLAPYRREAQSGVVLTAFHFGRPVIASRTGGIPEVVEDGVHGLLVPPENPEALAAAIDDFFGSRDRLAMETAVRERAAKLSWAEYAERVAALIEPD